MNCFGTFWDAKISKYQLYIAVENELGEKFAYTLHRDDYKEEPYIGSIIAWENIPEFESLERENRLPLSFFSADDVEEHIANYLAI